MNSKCDRERECADLTLTADSYLDAARLVCEDMVGGWSDYDMRVVQHLVHLALELFLKAGIVRAGANYPRSHDLTVLLREHDAVSEFRVKIPQFIQDKRGPATDLFPDYESKALAKFDERLRYPVDREGRWWRDHTDDAPESVLKDIDELSRQTTQFVLAILG